MKTAIPGLLLGHHSMGDTGCTVLVAPDSAVCSVDVRGGGPGTRETDLLNPSNTVQNVHAVLLTGGSAFGLDAAGGVMSELESRGIGFPVLGEGKPGPIVPIVPGAVIFDLLFGEASHRPGATDGAAAVRAAFSDAEDASFESSVGSVGAGVGATAGALRGGFGRASQQVGPKGQWTMEAFVVANPVGSVIDPTTGALWAQPHGPRVDTEAFAALVPLAARLNTTIGVIATDAPITKAQAKRLAMAGHDGIAVAVRPAHSPLDGDTLFCLSTAPAPNPEGYGGVDIEAMMHLSAAAANVVAGAIATAVRHAAGLEFGVTAWQDIVTA